MSRTPFSSARLWRMRCCGRSCRRVANRCLLNSTLPGALNWTSDWSDTVICLQADSNVFGDAGRRCSSSMRKMCRPRQRRCRARLEYDRRLAGSRERAARQRCHSTQCNPKHAVRGQPVGCEVLCRLGVLVCHLGPLAARPSGASRRAIRPQRSQKPFMLAIRLSTAEAFVN